MIALMDMGVCISQFEVTDYESGIKSEVDAEIHRDKAG